MRILHITPEAPNFTSGGAICVHQSLMMLDPAAHQIDYVGPKIERESIRALYHTAYELEPATSALELARIALHLQHNRRYLAWKRLGLDLSQYDLAYMDFTKLDYAAQDVKSAGVPLLVRVHNVESDYAKNDYQSGRSAVKAVTWALAKRHERHIVRAADRLLPLTAQDAARLRALYGAPERKTSVIPICLQDPEPAPRTPESGAAKLLVTGSLWYGVNLDGILWLIEKVLPRVGAECRLRVAGARPPEEFKTLCREKGIELIDTPPTMREHIEWCDAVVVPIFSGAGMKVKIAEALSYGKPVLTTSFGAIGYDMTQGKNAFIGDTPEAFAENVGRFCALAEGEKAEMMRSARALFETKYEMSIGRAALKEILAGTGQP